MKFKAWISAFRLRTLPLALSCVITGSGIAWINGTFNWAICLLTVLTTTLLQVLSNLANDYGDAVKGTDNKERLGPTRAIQSGVISPSEMKVGIITCGLLTLASGIWLLLISLTIDWKLFVMLGIGLAGIAAAIKYTVGKTAYGYKGMGDLFVFIFFGIVGVIGTTFLQTSEINLIDFIPASSIGLMSAGVLNLNNMRDHKNDKISNKKTLVVFMGYKAAKTYHLFLTILPIILMGVYLFLMGPKLSNLFLTIPLIILMLAIIKVYGTTDERKLDPELKKLALTTFLSAVLFTVSLCVSF